MLPLITLKYDDGVTTATYETAKLSLEPLAHAIERLTDLAEADGWTDVWLEHIIYNPKGVKKQWPKSLNTSETSTKRPSLN